MSQHSQLSRPARLAAGLTNKTDDQAVQMFTDARILLRLEDQFQLLADARETLLFAGNQILRFCPNLTVQIPNSSPDLMDELQELKREIHGENVLLLNALAQDAPIRDFNAILNIGTNLVHDLPWITVNSTGWIARAATARAPANELFWTPGLDNPCGALAAACLGAGLVFLTVLNQQPLLMREFSLFNHDDAEPGSLDQGPPLPALNLNLDAFLVGCGAVTNGWAYTIKRLPIAGQIQAIDKQSLKLENLGPYVLAKRSRLNIPKVSLIQDCLAPRINVTPRADEWELFKIRLRSGLPVPSVIINGLDNVLTRHSVQRLWPATLIDMAAGGLTSQIIVNRADDHGGCLLTALEVPQNELDWADRLAQQTGLRAERIRKDPTSEITQTDIDAADPSLRSGLEKSLGGPICGRITEQNLMMEGYDPDFAPAVPFVTAFSGVVGAAETMKHLMGSSQSLHYQGNFVSYRTRRIQMTCKSNCECQSR